MPTGTVHPSAQYTFFFPSTRQALAPHPSQLLPSTVSPWQPRDLSTDSVFVVKLFHHRLEWRAP